MVSYSNFAILTARDTDRFLALSRNERYEAALVCPPKFLLAMKGRVGRRYHFVLSPRNKLVGLRA